MKPIFDISNKKSFTVWESGCWNEQKNFGQSVIVAGPDGSKLPVIFDRDPKKGIRHALFYANVGGLIAGTYVKYKGDDLAYDIELVRITDITAVDPQAELHANPYESMSPDPFAGFPSSARRENPPGKFIPKYSSQRLFLSRQLVNPDATAEYLLRDLPDFESVPNAKELLELAIAKATTPLDQQRLFYGVPREVEAEQ